MLRTLVPKHPCQLFTRFHCCYASYLSAAPQPQIITTLTFINGLIFLCINILKEILWFYAVFTCVHRQPPLHTFSAKVYFSQSVQRTLPSTGKDLIVIQPHLVHSTTQNQIVWHHQKSKDGHMKEAISRHCPTLHYTLHIAYTIRKYPTLHSTRNTLHCSEHYQAALYNQTHRLSSALSAFFATGNICSWRFQPICANFISRWFSCIF